MLIGGSRRPAGWKRLHDRVQLEALDFPVTVFGGSFMNSTHRG
jgi:hypothetical protein